MFHHPSLHDILASGGVHAAYSDIGKLSSNCLLQIMKIYSVHGNLSVLWDSGASISLFTFRKAKELRLTGKSVLLSITKVGGQVERISSYLYTLPLVDENNIVIDIKVYGIENISQGQHIYDYNSVLPMFKGIKANDVQRLTMCKGQLEILMY